MQVRIEEQQQGSVAADVVRALDVAAAMPSLDRALEVLRAHIDGKRWDMGRGGNHVWLSWRTPYGAIRVAMIVDEKAEVVSEQRAARNWDEASLSVEAARQGDIERGDIVRAYDFPGSRDDVYVQGVVKEREAHRVLIHVTREVWCGNDEQVNRFEVWSPLGVSSMSGAPCVFLVAKREVRQ